jgi:hypothetical protein
LSEKPHDRWLTAVEAGDYLGYPGMPTGALSGHNAGNSVFARLSA